jgi:hypothetical protein
MTTSSAMANAALLPPLLPGAGSAGVPVEHTVQSATPSASVGGKSTVSKNSKVVTEPRVPACAGAVA